MAENIFLTGPERNFAVEAICGQANNGSLAVANAIHPVTGGTYTKAVALQQGKFIGMKSDGKWYLASAEAGAGQVKALALNFKEVANGQAVDAVREYHVIRLGAAISGAVSGAPAYLSDANPGEVVKDAPSGSGKIVQIVGTFINTREVAVDIQLIATTL